MTGRLLVVDDDQDMCEMLHDDLTQRGHSVRWHINADEALDEFMAEPFDTVVTDLRMPGLDGIDFCNRLTTNRPDVPVIVITAFGSLETAVEAIRAGAFDFVAKPVNLDILNISIERALKYRSLQEQVRFLKEQETKIEEWGDFIGRSRPMEQLFDQIRRVADREVPVLISGESGTGKELVAKALHRYSERARRPFIPVNCAALPANLLESELFGHARGAFTGAQNERQGLFQSADGGTLFLDEVAEMPLELQPKLLRALESGLVRPVGKSDEVHCDVRLITATNKDIDNAVRTGDFREDLFFRINVVQLEVPPLRARGNDVLLLAQHFLRQIAQRSNIPVKAISCGSAEKLLAYRWPGNVRELRNAIERAMAMTRFDELLVDDLPENIRNHQEPRMMLGGDASEELVTLETMEQKYIEYVLDRLGGNKSEAARVLGLGRRTLYRKLERETD